MHWGEKHTQKYQQGDAIEDGCTNPLVPIPWFHLNCYPKNYLNLAITIQAMGKEQCKSKAIPMQDILGWARTIMWKLRTNAPNIGIKSGYYLLEYASETHIER